MRVDPVATAPGSDFVCPRTRVGHSRFEKSLRVFGIF